MCEISARMRALISLFFTITVISVMIAYLMKYRISSSLASVPRIDPFALTQERRKARIKSVCENNQDWTYYKFYNKKRLSKQFKGSQVPLRLDQEHGLLWCKVPKGGSTTWSLIFEKLLGISKFKHKKGFRYWNEIHKKLKDKTNYKLAANLTEKVFTFRNDTVGKIPDELLRYKSFIIVRHPFERLYSAFQDKIVINKRKIIPGLNDPLTIAKKGEPTFAKFLSHIVKDQNVVFKYDEHWYPIYGLCRPCHVKFDFVLKVESLNEESIKLLDKLGLSEKVQVPHILSTNSTSSISDVDEARKLKYRRMMKNVDRKTLEKLLQIFHLDFEAFGYDDSYFREILDDLK